MSFLFGLSLTNFRVFRETQKMSFAPVTILTGPNSSGKSTVSHAVHLLKQQFQQNPFSFDGNVDITLLLSEVTYEKLGPKLGEFTKLINYESESFFEITIPAVFESHGQPTEIFLRYQKVDNVLPSGRLVSLKLREVNSGQELFSLVLTDGNLTARLSYTYFYHTYIQEREQLKILEAQIRDSIPAVNQDVDSSNEQVLDEMKRSVFGDLDVEFDIKNDGSVQVVYPWQFRTTGIEDDFEKSLAAANKEFRLIDDLPAKYFNADILIKIQDEAIHDVLFDSIAKDSRKWPNYYTTADRLNLKLLTYLDQVQFSAGSISSGTIYRTLRFPDSIGLPTHEIDNILLKEFSISNDNKRNSLHRLIDDRNPEYFTKFGVDFFSRYVQHRVLSELRNAFHLVNVEVFKNETSFSCSQIVNLAERSAAAEDLKTFLNVDKNVFERNKEFLVKWLNEFDIAEDITFTKSEQSVSVYLIRKGCKINIADEGYGLSRILPLLIKIANVACKSIDPTLGSNYYACLLVIEEPEAGLHPALQSKIADLLIDANKRFNMQLVIETHSEYLIRRMQVLVAREAVSPESIQIHYFYHPANIPEGEPQCFPVNIMMDGSLTRNFGPGFFDESSNLNIALYQVSKINQN